MSSLMSSRWADTPPAEETSTPQKPLQASPYTPNGAELSPPSEPDQKKADAGVFASRWADTPSPSAELVDTENVWRESMAQDVNALNMPISIEDENAQTEEATVETEISQKEENLSSSQRATKDLDMVEITDQPGEKALPALLPNESSMLANPFSQELHAPSASPSKLHLDIPRLKKKVSWRGKTCVISIPNLDYAALGLRQPWTATEYREHLQAFRDVGYDLTGFDISAKESIAGPVHAKPIYPDESETRIALLSDKAKVLLPDLQKWAAYMDQLTEQKLAALGVSSGPAEPVAPSPQQASRQSSAQYPPLPFSPPVPSTSAASFGRSGRARGHSHAMSVVSPVSPLNAPYGHAHRHSVFASPLGFQQYTQGFSSNLLSSPQDQIPPPQSLLVGSRSLSPQSQLAVPGFNSAASPAQMAALRGETGAAGGPGPPLTQQLLAQAVQDFSRSLSSSSNRQQNTPPTAVSPAWVNGPHANSLPQLPEEEDEDELLEKPEQEPGVDPESSSRPDLPTYVPPHKRAELNVNIATPTPRGHRHNISEGLERDILEAEKRQEAISRDYIVVEEENSGSSSDQEAAAPVAEITPEKDPLGLGYAVQELTVRNHKKTASRFNATAQPFKFNPGATFQPGSTAFNFGTPTTTTKLDKQPAFAHNRQVSSGAFNVAAPEFKPIGMSSLPKSEFNFSTTGPTFSPNAPVFGAPSKPMDFSSPASTSSIFGKVVIPDFIKPARRSKALPIKKPDADAAESLESGTEPEDEEGRIAQSEDRLKRQRKGGCDGDESPRFAEPTPLPEPATQYMKNPDAEPDMLDDSLASGQAEAGADDSADDTADLEDSQADDASEHAFDLARGVPELVKLPHRHNRSSSLSALAKPFQPFASRHMELVEPEEVQESDFTGGYQDAEYEESEFGEPHLLSSPLRVRDLPSLRDARPDLATNLHESHIPAVHSAEPSFDEIDAVMRRLNEADADEDPPEPASISPLPSSASNIMRGVTYLPGWDRSDAPSPSPRRRPIEQDAERDASYNIHERTDSGEKALNEQLHLNPLNRAAEAPTSDWSADFPAQDDEKLNIRANVLDTSIDNLLGRLLEKRLLSLEETLQAIHSSINKRPISRDLTLKRTSSTVESDADDEDELSDSQRQRPISRGRDKKADQIKAVVMEALQEQSSRHRLELEDIRAVIEDAVGRQNEALVPIGLDPIERGSAHSRGPSELETRLNETLAGMLEEANLRRAAEEREAESRRALQYAEDELRNLRNSTRDYEAQLDAVSREKEELIQRVDAAEDVQSDLEDQVKDAKAEYEATYATLEEYRTSSNNWRKHIDELTAKREDLNDELEDLKAQLKQSEQSGSVIRGDYESVTRQRDELTTQRDELKLQLKSSQDSMVFLRGDLDVAMRQRDEFDGQRNELKQQLKQSEDSLVAQRADFDVLKRERDELEGIMAALERDLNERQEASLGMRRKLETLHSELSNVAGQLVSERSLWSSKEAEHLKKHESLETQIAAHSQERSRLEGQVRDLEAGVREISETKSALDQTHASSTSLDELVRKLQVELTEQQSIAKTFERELHDAKEIGRVEVQRLQLSAEKDLEAAKHQANVMRIEFESQVARLQAKLENARVEADAKNVRHERVRQEQASEHEDTLRKVNSVHSAALDETLQKHEATLVVLRADHKRALGHAVEDKQRSELFLNERLALSDAKLQHFQDKILHLEERIEVAKSAAQAAAMSAQSRALPNVASVRSALPEKISPQALRESILVLQDQLQDRETQLEKLRSKAENDTSTKLKSRDDEIVWLRELLANRSEELTDLVNTLAQPTFDRNTVRDTAIRIRANLQMEQQEKERFIGGANQNITPAQAIASLSSFATPKAAQLTSAFNKWRTSMESSALRTATPSAATAIAAHRRAATPSKAPISSSSAPLGYTLGLMTPPASNLRNTPSPEPAASLPPPRLQSRNTSRASTGSATAPKVKDRQLSFEEPEEPSTPALFRAQSFDDDAQDHKVQMHSLDEETIEDDDDLEGVEDNKAPAFRNLEAEMGDAGAGAEEKPAEEEAVST